MNKIRRNFKSPFRIIKLFYILLFFIPGLSVLGQKETDDQKRDLAFFTATKKWFSAWKLVSTDIYKINKVSPVEFVFFDDKYVYSTSNVTISNGIIVKGNNLMNLKFKWKKALHNESILLPDSSVTSVKLMSFAAEIPNEINKSFFVMPLPELWKKFGVTSKELGLENLTTGVFIHEFSHSQQMQNFGKKITGYEQQNNFGVEFSDDIVQNIFEKDTAYLNFFKVEVGHFYNAVKKNKFDKFYVNEGLTVMKERQKKYFNGKHNNLVEIDNFFLTMEGLGQYSMFLWLQHPNGGNIKRESAIGGVRRGRKWWSQDEGFALFLILHNLTEPEKWAKDMFGVKTESIIFLIDKFL